MQGDAFRAMCAVAALPLDDKASPGEPNRGRNYEPVTKTAIADIHGGITWCPVRRSPPTMHCVPCVASRGSLSIALALCLSVALYDLMNSPAPSSKFFRCPHCPTEYWVTYSATPTRDSGSAYCKVCRKKMIDFRRRTGQPVPRIQRVGCSPCAYRH